MIKKALEYIVGLNAPDIREINGETWSDKNLYRVSHNPVAKPIHMNTLTSLVDYILSDADEKRPVHFVHIESPTRIVLRSVLDKDRVREELVICEAQVPNFNFNTFIEKENFIIGLQSKFIDSADRSLLLKFAGTVESGTVASYGDDGITQKATIKNGLASRSEAIVPNPVFLQPYRTFTEVTQPASNFIFRMRESRGVECAIFEADGGAWKNEAMKNIKEYIQRKLEGRTDFIVIC